MENDRCSLPEPSSELQSIVHIEKPSEQKIPILNIINIDKLSDVELERLSSKIVKKCNSKQQERSSDHTSSSHFTTIMQQSQQQYEKNASI